MDLIRKADGTVEEVDGLPLGKAWRGRFDADLGRVVYAEIPQVKAGGGFSTKAPAKYQMNKKGSPTKRQARRRLKDIGLHPYPKDIEQLQAQSKMTERDKEVHSRDVADSLVGGLDAEAEATVFSEKPKGLNKDLNVVDLEEPQ